MARAARRPVPSDDTRARILTAARGLFSARQRSTTPTVAELARRAGVSRATVHRYFRSRDELLRAMDVAPKPGARERAITAGIELLARDGLAHLSMDEVAERAGVSRANLYRLFPGKPALFTELIRVYSPLEPIGTTVTRLKDEPPDVVMPEVALAVVGHLEGRIGLVRALLFEAASPSSEADAARQLALQTALVPLASYLSTQMELGRIRRMSPLLALQAFAGPIIFHLVLRPFAESLLGFDVSMADAVVELARTWLAAMRPDQRDC